MGIGQRLTKERTRLGLSQEDFGAQGGVARNAQANYESEKRSPDAAYLSAIAAIGVDVHYVLTGVRAREIDGTLLGMCEAAMRQAYLDARPSAKHVGVVRLSALTKVYNDLQMRLLPSHDVSKAVREAAERYIAWLDDPADPGLLERALFREAPSAPERGGHHVSADRGSNAAVGDITIGAPTKGKKR